jgi:hypothetical protein
MATTHLSSGYQTALMTHIMPTTLQATDWETFLVHIGVVDLLTIILITFFII